MDEFDIPVTGLLIPTGRYRLRCTKLVMEENPFYDADDPENNKHEKRIAAEFTIIGGEFDGVTHEEYCSPVFSPRAKLGAWTMGANGWPSLPACNFRKEFLMEPEFYGDIAVYTKEKGKNAGTDGNKIMKLSALNGPRPFPALDAAPAAAPAPAAAAADFDNPDIPF